MACLPFARPTAILTLASLPLFAAPVFGQDAAQEPTAEVEGLAGPRVEIARKAARRLPSQRLGIAAEPIPEVRLPELDLEALLREDAAAWRDAAPKPQRIGVGREISVGVLDGIWWELGATGRLWIADVAASGAAGMRLHLAELELPDGAELALYAPALGADMDQALGEPLFLGAADRSDLWTGTFFGERVRIEYYDPAGTDIGALPFRIEKLQHLYHDPLARALTGVDKAAGSCHNDVTCFPEWSGVAAATARFSAIDGDSFLCTGQLLNNKKSDFTPFFLTAEHCRVGSPAVADTMELFWHYETATCGGVPPAPNDVPRSRRASVVGNAPSSDGTLVLAEGTLPGGLFFLGWNAGKIADGTSATAVHHPDGDFKRISFGTKLKAGECASAGKNFLKLDWTDGPTEPGSSGSGIYTNSSQHLFGTLSFGPSSCADESYDCYGAFAAHYKVATFKNALVKGGTDDNLEQNDSCNKAKVLKQLGTYGGRIVKLNDEDYFRMSVPAGRTITISLGFSHGNGDVDLAAFASCADGPLAESTGSGNSESIAVTNVGGQAANLFWRVFLADDVRNAYDMSVALE